MKKILFIVLVFSLSFVLSSCGYADEITFNCPTESLKVGDTITLDFTTKPADKNDKVYISSEDDSIATITDDDKVLGVAPGMVRITIEDHWDSDVHDKCDIIIIE